MKKIILSILSICFVVGCAATVPNDAISAYEKLNKEKFYRAKGEGYFSHLYDINLLLKSKCDSLSKRCDSLQDKLNWIANYNFK
jgi:hypothetical protein